jgi:hypothetical protein
VPFYVYIFPLFIVLFMLVYYGRLYAKGRAVGGGIGAGVQKAIIDKWQPVMGPGEMVIHLGSGQLQRSDMKTWLAWNIPLFRLIWPPVYYQMAITSQGRLLVGRVRSLGGLSQVAHLQGARVASATMDQEYAEVRYYSIVLATPAGPHGYTWVPEQFVQALGSGAVQ